MLPTEETKTFWKSLRRAKRREYDIEALFHVVSILQKRKPLPPEYQDHPLRGIWKGHRECHVEDDWLLIYRLKKNKLVLIDIGTHQELFGK